MLLVVVVLLKFDLVNHLTLTSTNSLVKFKQIRHILDDFGRREEVGSAEGAGRLPLVPRD